MYLNESGRTETHDFGKGRFASEAVFVPRARPEGQECREDDGFLLHVVYDSTTDSSDLVGGYLSPSWYRSHCKTTIPLCTGDTGRQAGRRVAPTVHDTPARSCPLYLPRDLDPRDLWRWGAILLRPCNALNRIKASHRFPYPDRTS